MSDRHPDSHTTGGRPRGWGGLATATLAALIAINLLNYLDRYVLSAVLPGIADEFGLADRQSGLLGGMFMITYMLFSPFAGYLGDRTTRKYVIAAGVALWSLATIGSGLATSYEALLLTRALIGVGEACYAVIAPGLIADLYREQYRGRVLAYFYMAIPVGTALGYLVGGAIGESFGWRPAFFVAGAPGVVMALVALGIREPVRGAMDEVPEAGPRLSPWEALVRLLRTPVWRMVTVAMTLSTFCIGGLAFWMPTFLVRTQGMTTASAGSALGGMLVVTGILGALVGGMLGDWATSRWRGGHLLVSALAVGTAAPLVSAMPFLPRTEWVLAFGFGALFLLGLTAGPINAALVGCVPAGLRSIAVAVNNVVLHLLGDALSPYLIGWISDVTNLRIAVSLSAVPVALAGLILLPGALRVNRWPDGLRYYPAPPGGDE